MGCPMGPPWILCSLPPKAISQKTPTILANILAMWESMYIFHPLELLWVIVQKSPHVNLKRGPVTLSTNEKRRISQETMA